MNQSTLNPNSQFHSFPLQTQYSGALSSCPKSPMAQEPSNKGLFLLFRSHKIILSMQLHACSVCLPYLAHASQQQPSLCFLHTSSVSLSTQEPPHMCLTLICISYTYQNTHTHNTHALPHTHTHSMPPCYLGIVNNELFLHVSYLLICWSHQT